MFSHNEPNDNVFTVQPRRAAVNTTLSASAAVRHVQVVSALLCGNWQDFN